MTTRRQLLGLMIGGLLAPWEGIRRALWPPGWKKYIWTAWPPGSVNGPIQANLWVVLQNEQDAYEETTGLRELMYGQDNRKGEGDA
jgi:hypothetical protein